MAGVMQKGYNRVRSVFRPSDTFLKKAFPTATREARKTAKFIIGIGYQGYTSMEQGFPVSKIEKIPNKAVRKIRRGLGV
jgi:hypothetical protein